MIFLCRKLVGNRYFALKQCNSSQAKISNPFNGGSTVKSKCSPIESGEASPVKSEKLSK